VCCCRRRRRLAWLGQQRCATARRPAGTTTRRDGTARRATVSSASPPRHSTPLGRTALHCSPRPGVLAPRHAPHGTAGLRTRRVRPGLAGRDGRRGRRHGETARRDGRRSALHRRHVTPRHWDALHCTARHVPACWLLATRRTAPLDCAHTRQGRPAQHEQKKRQCIQQYITESIIAISKH
jgi:hypothetical protein